MTAFIDPLGLRALTFYLLCCSFFSLYCKQWYSTLDCLLSTVIDLTTKSLITACKMAKMGLKFLVFSAIEGEYE